jgi:hypothetical protein
LKLTTDYVRGGQIIVACFSYKKLLRRR